MLRAYFRLTNERREDIVLKEIALAAAVLAVSGCAQQTFKINNGAERRPAKEVSQAFFFSGIGQTKTLNAANICHGAENVARIETQATAFDVIVTTLTLSIYSPRDARIYCVNKNITQKSL